MMKNVDDDTWNLLHMLAEEAEKFYEEYQRLKKGKTKIVYDEQEETVNSFFDSVSVPRKVRSSLKKSHSEGASTSSSSSSLVLNLNNKINPSPWSSSLTFKRTKNPIRFKPCSSRLFADYYMEMENSLNPSSQSSLSSCVTEDKSRKRRALDEKKVSGVSKKAKVVHLSWKGREIPQSLVKMMRGMNVFEEPKLIFEKGLFATDVNSGESRLSMPSARIISDDFLTCEEVRILKEDISNPKKIGFGAVLVDQRGEKWGVFLKRWETQGKANWIYSLTCGWNDLVEANGLKEDDGISVWTFRWRGLLCFALVPPPENGQSSSSSSITL